MSEDDYTTIRVHEDDKLRLERFGHKRGADSFAEAVSYALDEAETTISFEEFTDRVFDEFGDDVAQLALWDESQHTGELMFVAHVPADQWAEQHGIFDDVDYVEIEGTPYRFTLDLSYDGPQEFGRITIYASDNILGMEGTDLEDGIDAVIDFINDQDELVAEK